MRGQIKAIQVSALGEIKIFSKSGFTPRKKRWNWEAGAHPDPGQLVSWGGRDGGGEEHPCWTPNLEWPPPQWQERYNWDHNSLSLLACFFFNCPDQSCSFRLKLINEFLFLSDVSTFWEIHFEKYFLRNTFWSSSMNFSFSLTYQLDQMHLACRTQWWNPTKFWVQRPQK